MIRLSLVEADRKLLASAIGETQVPNGMQALGISLLSAVEQDDKLSAAQVRLLLDILHAALQAGPRIRLARDFTRFRDTIIADMRNVGPEDEEAQPAEEE